MLNNNNIQYNPQIPTAQTLPVQGNLPPQTYPQNTGFAPQPSYGADQTSFSPVAPPPPAPAVEVGLFDKMKSYFTDVYRTDDNLLAYKQFQNTVDNNPQTIQPGSGDTQRVQDLQQKLNMAGLSANVNGIYGYATGEAVKEFKGKMGITDGFLDSKGQPAVTDIATPQMQAVLNSVVSNKLNPNHTGPVNPLPVTQQDMAWAQDLLSRSQNFGYKPNAQEHARYQDILARQQMHNTPQVPVAQPVQPSVPIYQPAPVTPTGPPVQQPGLPPVTQQEMNWALAMQTNIEAGYRPSAQEVQAYDDIQKRHAAHQASTPQPAAPVQPVAPQPVTQGELDWAMGMQAKIENQAYRPTADEAARYTDIQTRYAAQPAKPAPPVKTEPTYNPVDTAPLIIDKSVSTEEYKWALDLLFRIDSEGYQPSRTEVARYSDIFYRYEAQNAAKPTDPVVTEPTQPNAPVAPQQPVAPPANVNAATQEEVQWVRKMSGKIAQGHQPSMIEMAKFNAIQLKMATYGVQEVTAATPSSGGPVSQSEIDWALQLQHKVQFENYQPTQQEVDNYTDIYARYNAQAQSAPTPAPAAQSATGAASQQDIQWALQLEEKVKQGYQPQPQEITRYQGIAAQVQAAQGQTGPAPVAPTPAPQAQTGPSQADVQWAGQLMDAVKNGYKASNDEMARYTDIYNRLQQGGAQQPQTTTQPVAPTAPTAPAVPAAPAAPGSVNIDVSSGDHELQWALNLLDRFRQGYQPNQFELSMYEQIISRKAVPNATP